MNTVLCNVYSWPQVISHQDTIIPFESMNVRVPDWMPGRAA